MAEIETDQSMSRQKALGEVIAYFLRLGLFGFGGPAAHIAMMHDDIVRKRKWVDEQKFLDLLGAVNMIPGPNSTEMTIHLGYVRAGWPGLIAGGVCFILPAMLIVTGLAWAYSEYGSTPAAGWLLYGIKPVVIGIIVDALITLGRKVFNRPVGAVLGIAAAAAALLGVNELMLILAAGILALMIRAYQTGTHKTAPAWIPLFGTPAAVLASQPFRLDVLFFVFLKIGAVLFGSGYVLLAFLKADFVDRLGWLTSQQLVDAIAIGQVTPGPLFTTATFIGYQLGGLSGGLVATIGIFLPSFLFVALTHSLIPRIRRSTLASAVLDGVTAASLGLMAAVTIELGRTALVDIFTVLLALAAFLAVRLVKVNSTWIVLGGLLAGVARWLVG